MMRFTKLRSEAACNIQRVYAAVPFDWFSSSWLKQTVKVAAKFAQK